MKPTISFEDFAKLDLRTATIKKVEEIQGADKLYKLTIDVGELGERTICAGIKQHYKPEDLEGKQIIIIANLEPRKMRGTESQGMLLAVDLPDDKDCILLTPEKKVKEGMEVS